MIQNPAGSSASGMRSKFIPHIPLARHPLGFWLMLVLQLAIGGLLVWLLKRRRWL